MSVTKTKEQQTAPSMHTIQDYTTTIMILESISDAIFILSNKRKIEYANKSALDLLQVSLEEISGQDFTRYLVDSKDYAMSKESNISSLNPKNFIDKISDGILGSIEISVKSKKNIIPILLNFSLINGVDGSVKYVIVTAKDITDWKVLEKELQNQQVISIYQERQRLLGELFEGLLHELSQPLVSMQLRMELLQSYQKKEGDFKTRIDKSNSEMMGLISTMSAVIENLRKFTHQSSSEHIAMVNVNEIMENISKLLSYEFQKQHINFEMRTEGKLSPIRTNPMFLQQVFLNIIKNSRDAFDSKTNAIKYNRENPRKILIITRAIGKKWLEMTFVDNAGGIDKKIRDKIFDPFFSTKTEVTHSGVGLSIVQNIISSLGGDISIDVEDNIGTAITIKIPVTQNEEQDQLFNLIELLNKQ